ncbi:MAG: MFS transporter [Verrucomicrobiota bacterium]
MIEPAATPATPAARFPNGPFIRYMLGEGISMTGTWMQAMAQGWVMAGLTGSSLAIAAVNFAGGLPMLILFRIGGMYADKYDKAYYCHGADVSKGSGGQACCFSRNQRVRYSFRAYFHVCYPYQRNERAGQLLLSRAEGGIIGNKDRHARKTLI